MAQFMGPLSIGLQLAGSVYGAVSESNQLRGEARQLDANAIDAENQGAAAVLDQRRRARAVQGEALAALGVNGGDISTGSALDVLTQNSVEAEWDILRTRYGAARDATAMRAEAASRRKAASGALFGGLIGAAAQAFGAIDQRNSAAQVRSAVAAGRVPTTVAMPGTRMPVPAGIGAAGYGVFGGY